jgi:hypothetical protein
MDELEPHFLIDVIGHIYEAAADPDHWQELVTLLERAYPHSRVTLFAHEKGQPLKSLSVSRCLGPLKLSHSCFASGRFFDGSEAVFGRGVSGSFAAGRG